MGVAAGSGNTDFVSAKTNMDNCPDAQALHPMPSACGSARVNSNLSNLGKKRCRSEEAGTYSNMSCYLWRLTDLSTSFGLRSEDVSPFHSMIKNICSLISCIVCKLTKIFAAICCMVCERKVKKSSFSLEFILICLKTLTSILRCSLCLAEE